MEVSWLLTAILLILSVTIKIIQIIKRETNLPTNLPPGPPKLPLIGNLHQLASKNTLPHRRLAELARVYGPIMHLQLGEIPVVVISSPEMAKEVLKTHDAKLCSRPKMMATEVVFYNSTDIALAPYGEYWRQVRKIATLELFTLHRVQTFRPIREAEVLDVMRALVYEANAGSVVNLGNIIFNLNFDIILRIIMKKKGRDGKECRQIVTGLAEIASGFSVSDLYPSLKFINSINGMKSKLQGIVKRFDNLMDPILEEHLRNKIRGNNEEEEDLVDILLRYYKDDNQLQGTKFILSINNIKAIIFELLGAASETSSTTIEWALSELLRNPKEMEKAQNEARRVMSAKTVMINEASLDNLQYLKLVIKETLRLHPPFPLLVPREAMERCKVEGYQLPSKTRVFTNAWAIGRDPKYWQDPEKFMPERFHGSDIDYKGNNFELIPFGAGRRICPGMGLGIATIELALAMLLYHFDWKLPHGCKPEDLDMDETFGIVGRKKKELQVMPMLQPLSSLNKNFI